jgi:hypothetical protein
MLSLDLRAHHQTTAGCDWQRTLQASPLPGMEKKGKKVLERKCS